VLASGSELIDDIKRAPDDVLSDDVLPRRELFGFRLEGHSILRLST
jgi:hypothetical protein